MTKDSTKSKMVEANLKAGIIAAKLQALAQAALSTHKAVEAAREEACERMNVVGKGAPLFRPSQYLEDSLADGLHRQAEGLQGEFSSLCSDVASADLQASIRSDLDTVFRLCREISP